MPVYEYRCKKCGEVFEHREHIAEHAGAHPPCPKCKSEEVEQMLSESFVKTAKKS